VAQRGVIVARRPTPVQRRQVRRKRLLTRAVPIAAIATIAFVGGAIFATEPGRQERQVVSRYVTAWEHHDYAAMYKLLDSGSRRRVSEAKFANELRSAAATATLISLTHSRVTSGANNTIAVQMLARTRIWGALPETLAVPFTGSGSGARIHLTPQVLFPGVRPGERLHRVMKLPPRAAILASDRTPLAQGPDRSSPIPDVADQIVGTLGPIPTIDAMQYAAAGYPPNAEVGLDGLERIFQTRLAGRPGGRLMAGHRLLASAAARAAGPVTTTISPALERETVAAMGGRYSGITVMNPRTGALLALAGIAFSAPQPPGSTMKIITATAALQAGIAKLTTQFPIQTSATIDGYTLQNSNGEACGGTLLNAFAVSCNSVFAPLGASVGADRLVAMAKRFGFDQPSSIAGAAESSIPSASKIGDALAVGSSAIGQGVVQTTPLEMADVAATIAMGGRRPIPTLLAHQRPRFVRVTSARVAHEVQQMMIAVIDYGTGTSAQIPGVEVAGKTGTAELTDTATTSNNPNASSPKNTDAWFVAYAPVGHPRYVVGALFPNQGFGGAAAAPPVRQILVSALQH
jgi:Penicillin binding protein transpeptidase domain/Penicillin-binding Protein dimerisation domain